MKVQTRAPRTSFHQAALIHDCAVVGEVEVSDDWRFCPWCGKGLVRAIRKALNDDPWARPVNDLRHQL